MKSSVTKKVVLEKTIEFMQNHSFNEYEKIIDLAAELLDHRNGMVTSDKEALKLLNNFEEGNPFSSGVAIEYMKALMLMGAGADVDKMSVQAYPFIAVNFSSPVSVTNGLLGVCATVLFSFYPAEELNLEGVSTMTQKHYVQILQVFKNHLKDSDVDESIFDTIRKF